MKTITIEGQLRSDFGKKATRLLRSEEQVPCVIYGGAETVSFSAPAKQFKDLVYTPDFQLAEVKIGGKSYRCVLKDLQFDVVTDELSHVDFLELVEDKEVLVSLPIKIVGQSEGVKAGGKLVVKLKSLKVKALPKHLRENIEVSIDGLQLNGNIRVEDVKTDNITITNSPRIPIASVVMTRQLRQEEAAEGKKK
ncbi:50S ribosomal protein L25 [Chitinophaga parva]|uniref:Large ribosomal subunit protein bL25 n=1 Tax=Chitinophaga parva TaxID=2169414 RepID=A0A2T7BEU0_9BACT|nr:50S ribosomal protein L25 [Chitinophaga parva]PUZ24799.1 50S ribosomal protein L25 [Chitinophaga parva]